ncbi:MAG: glycosyltransferase [Bacteroidales bacterium]|nr:MAG: glycosyltransferase [Bacteroidales bacterium]
MKILFWLSLFLLVHSYLLYPLILRIVSRRKKINQLCYSRSDELPEITVLMSAFNEEKVLRKKIGSIFTTDYPSERLNVLVGSDASTDHTNDILKELSQSIPGLSFYPFEERQGKANIINQLAEKTDSEILVLTDANVMLEKSTLFEMVKHFRNPEIGLVDTNMINLGLEKQGISIQEKVYISFEVRIKDMEGRTWGTMMGPFGGCYAVRKELYTPVPKNFLVDDFFINMKIIEKGKKSINDLKARVFEDVSNNLADEYKRKARIAAGNFQNLIEFFHLLRNPFSRVAFSFISHKILRWLGPFFLLGVFLANLFIRTSNDLYFYTLLIQCVIFIMPLLDYLLRKIHIHILILRFITHFLTMNLAIMHGFIRFITGIQSNVWQPTRRDQTEHA